MAFQRKCVERMNQFRAEQKTMVCTQSVQGSAHAIWIDKARSGRGDSDKVVGHYEDSQQQIYNTIRDDLPEELEQAERRKSLTGRRINSLAVRDTDGKVLDELEALPDVTLQMDIEVLNAAYRPFGFALMKSVEEPMAFSPPTSRCGERTI